MNLCIDVGNTTIGIGFFKEETLIKRLIYTVDIKKTKDEYVSLIRNALLESSIKENDIKHIIFSSVVPSVNTHFINALKEVLEIDPLLIAPGIKTGLMLKVDHPNEVGNDLVAVMVGTKEKYGYPTIVADLGTASKVLVIDKDGAFVSCLIMPGISLSLNSLTERAALLPEVSLYNPKTIMAKNTVDAINAGVVYGHSDMIKGAIERYEKELGYKTKHVLCGGGSIYVHELLKDSFIHDQDLCLKGLNIIIRRNEELKNEK